MMDDRLPTELWVNANIRQCQSRNIPVYVEKKGDPHTGTILLKILDADFRCRLFGQMRDMDGALKWFDRLSGEDMAEAEAEALAQSLTRSDPDIWVIAVETRDGKMPFDGEIMTI